MSEKDYNGWNKLHIYAFKNNYKDLYEALNAGANPNVKSEKLVSYGRYVSFFKYKKMEKNYFVNITPLQLAAEKGHHKCVKLLMERGADPMIKSHSVYSPNSKINSFGIAKLFSKFKSYYIMKTTKPKLNTLLNFN